MRIVERSSLNSRRAAVVAAAVAAVLTLAGCTAQTPAKPSLEEITADLGAWFENRPEVLDVTQAPGFDDDDIVLEVTAEPGITDAQIREIGDHLATAPRSLQLSVDISAGDDVWSSYTGSDSPGIVETVIWLRNDPRVTSADVDSLSADGAVALADVFATAADFHEAMQGKDITERLIIEQSEIGVGEYGKGTQVETVAEKPYPSEAVEAAKELLAAYPSTAVAVSLLEGKYELNARAVFDRSVDVAEARTAATGTFGRLLAAATIAIAIGPVNATLDELTDDRIPFVRAMIAAAEVTDVRFGSFGSDAPDFTVTGSAASWAAANDAVVATLAEPALGHWIAGEARVQAPALAAGDPYRAVIPRLVDLTSARWITVAEGELLVDLSADVDDAELTALVTTVREAGLAPTVVLSLRSYDEDDKRLLWAKVVDGVVIDDTIDERFAELRQRFSVIWSQ